MTTPTPAPLQEKRVNIVTSFDQVAHGLRLAKECASKLANAANWHALEAHLVRITQTIPDGSWTTYGPSAIHLESPSAPQQAEGEREAFETWLRKESGPPLTDPAHEYFYTDVRAGWRAWQARAALSSPQPTNDREHDKMSKYDDEEYYAYKALIAQILRPQDRVVRFSGVDPLDIAKGAALPMIPDSWRFGFRSDDDGTLTFGFRDDGPLVAHAAVAPQPAVPAEAPSAAHAEFLSAMSEVLAKMDDEKLVARVQDAWAGLGSARQLPQGDEPAWVARKAAMDATDDGSVPWHFGEREPHWAEFKAWAAEKLGQGYSLAVSEGRVVDPTTGWAFTAFQAARASEPVRRPLTEAAIIELRDSLLPSQGEPFDCVAFGRALEKAHQIGGDA